uniref:Ion_trans domain-containing protein n=1 Tax=Macrostomum lignano TaxID=282301 RepID=A0A1I8GIZ2_9PLAT
AAPQTEKLLGRLSRAPLGRLRSSGNLLTSFWKTIRRQVKQLIDHRFFQRGILIAILINTMSMGIEFHNQPQTLTDIIEYSNVFFCGVFALEMLLKLLGDGLIDYVSSGFNVFDASIVILSGFELLQGHGSGLSVLRTFRLLRILKLVRFLPALRQQLFVMLKTMDNVATFFALLVLFIFIFSVLGMTLFGGKFCWHPDGSTCTCSERADPDTDCECDRANFDSIMWSLVTVF